MVTASKREYPKLKQGYEVVTQKGFNMDVDLQGLVERLRAAAVEVQARLVEAQERLAPLRAAVDMVVAEIKNLRDADEKEDDPDAA